MKGFCYGLLSIGFFLASSLFLSCEIRRRTNDNSGMQAGTVTLVAADDIEDTKHTETIASIVSEPEISRLRSIPLKIFVMVGQSNMAGHGYMDKMDDNGRFLNGTLEWMVETDPERYGKLKTYNENGVASWKERNDVWITYNRQKVGNVRPESNQHGALVPGYGGDPGQEGHEMGPELGFGWTVGDAMEKADDADTNTVANILLLKVAWGGRSLAVEYRPPSSGGTTGLYYEAMLANVYKTLSNLSEIVPGYTPNRGYELAGFAWHQGWNDGCDATMAAEYESNLANLIRDVRADLGVPNLPVSIGVSGMNGWHPDDPKRTTIVNAQLAVANATRYPEFEGTVASVETRDFYREAKPSSPGDQIYHWNNNCESYWRIGQAMGEAMIDLIRKTTKSIEEKPLRGTNGFGSTAIE